MCFHEVILNRFLERLSFSLNIFCPLLRRLHLLFLDLYLLCFVYSRNPFIVELTHLDDEQLTF